ncbi:MAG TPA: GAF domain-containing protein [Thermoleophilaceae bacterium]|nr:GAF domain-containing protein [Thermoleophilaceae bacterium]
MKQGVSDVVSVFDAFGLGIYCADLDGRFTYVNPAAQRLLGWSADELLGRVVHDTIHHSHPDGSPFARKDCPLHQALDHVMAEQDLHDQFWRRDGAPLEIAQTIAPLLEKDKLIGAIVVFVDVGQRNRDTDALRRRAAQQSALAELGLLALGDDSLQALVDQGTALVAEMLDVDLALVFELDPHTSRLRLRAGTGMRAGLVGKLTLETGRGSLAGFAIARDQPVVLEDPQAERRFRTSPFLLEHEIVSGVVVVIQGRGGHGETLPWGVLGAYARSRREFSEEDITFLKTVANTVGLAIERDDAEHEVQRRSREIGELLEQVSKLADDRQRIMANALDAEDRAREQVAELLHDSVLQSLLTARQDLAKLRPSGSVGDDVASRATEALVTAIRELRSAVTALHPVMHGRDGLAAAINSIANLHADHAGFEVSVDVEPWAAGQRSQLIISIAQELLSNVTRHAEASHVTITLRRDPGGIAFEVADDGCGMTPSRPEHALDRGYVGLASIAMRVESLGGSFELASSPGAGTRVRTVIPVGTPAARAGSSASSHPSSREARS